MDNDAITFNQPTGSRPPDRRELLWNELEQLHKQLGIDPPTATYSLEALAEEVALARRACASIPDAADRLHVDASVQQQVGAALEDTFGERILDAQQTAAHRRMHKTWRSFYGPLLLGEPPTPDLDKSMPHEDESSRRRSVARPRLGARAVRAAPSTTSSTHVTHVGRVKCNALFGHCKHIQYIP